MALIKAYSRRSFVSILITGVVFLAIAIGGIYYGLQYIKKEMAQLVTEGMTAAELAGQSAGLLDQHFVYGAAVLAGIGLLLGLILWLGLRRTVRRILKDIPGDRPSKPAKAKASETERQAERRHQQRMFLHLLSVLQREGRLVDFFSENLEQYEDAQIGAAVRGIHENCKKTLDKNLKLQPVIDSVEGEQTQVDPGFDPHAIKLTGNVAGDPPFKGVLRHRGWRTTKLELPTLSDVQDAGIIAPAEVEII